MPVAYRHSSEINWCIINGEGFIRSLSSGAPLALNGSATLIWQWLREGRTSEDLERALAGSFDDTGEVMQDIDAFLSELTEHNLIASVTDAASAEPITPRGGRSCGYMRPSLRPLAGDPSRAERHSWA